MKCFLCFFLFSNSVVQLLDLPSKMLLLKKVAHFLALRSLVMIQRNHSNTVIVC